MPLNSYKKYALSTHAFLLWAALFFMPLGLDSFTLSQCSIYFCYGLLAMSLSLIWGQVGLLCLGQAIFFGLGAYAMSLVTLGKIPLITQAHMIIGLGLAIIIPIVIAYLMSLLLFNGNRLDGAFLGLVTLALAVIAERGVAHWGYAGGSNGLFGVPGLGFSITNAFDEVWVYYITLSLAALIAIGLYALSRSPIGLYLKAIADNESRCNHLGVHTARIKALIFMLSAGIAGLAGALFVTQFYFASPNLLGFGLSTEVLIWVAVGGRFSYTGAFFGAVIVRVLENYLGDYAGSYWQLMLGVCFVLIVLYFPKGLLGHWVK